MVLRPVVLKEVRKSTILRARSLEPAPYIEVEPGSRLEVTVASDQAWRQAWEAWRHASKALAPTGVYPFNTCQLVRLKQRDAAAAAQQPAAAPGFENPSARFWPLRRS